MDSLDQNIMNGNFGLGEPSLLYVSTGTVMAWPSPTLPKMAGEITSSEGSWIGSLYACGAILGPWVTGATIDSIGRKGSLVLTSFFFLLSWGILATSETLWVIYLSRVIAGIGVGSSFSGVSVYIAEIAQDDLRGALGAFNQMFVGLGFMVEYCVGPYVSYTTLVLVSFCVNLVFPLAFAFMPESPYYLLKAGKKERALSSLCWLRGNVLPFMVEREFSSLKETVAESAKRQGQFRDFIRRGFVKALLICFYLMVVQQLSGFNAIVSFTQPLFELEKIDIPSTVSAMLVGGVNLFASAFAPPLVKTFGIKAIFIFSAVGMGICQMGIAAFFLVRSEGFNTVNINFLPVTALMIYNIFFCIGVAPLPWAVVAEMFPGHLKGLAASLCGTVSWALAFSVIKGYGVFVDQIGPFPVFTFFSCCLLAGAVGVYFVLPNTKGMSLQDIQDVLNRKRSDSTEQLEEY